MKQIVNTDPIADMLTRIRNGIAVGKSEVRMPHSKVKETVAKILADNGFLSSVKASEEGGRKVLTVVITGSDEPAKITEISRISRPGRRVYVKAADIPSVKRGRGIVVVSTSHGVMSGKEAVNQHLGGELICQVY
ncbi:MAG TPA: 30S ribosomal protein S8 [Candidatus Saccharimonadales bacterium]|nr:30S ribosomal protein S8 [Candidatus Saccharimonadales bacterium]